LAQASESRLSASLPQLPASMSHAMEWAQPAQAELGFAGDSSEGEVSQLATDGEVEARQAKSWRLFAATGTLGVACLLGVLALAALHGMQPARRAEPLTVRSLLEGKELAEVATENLMAMGGADRGTLDRDQVREHVARGLQNISATIRQRFPEAHDQLSKLQLSGEQKDAALQVLSKYGDARVVGLSHDITEAVRTSTLGGASQEEAQRRLAERLRPRLAEIRQLSEEMLPGQQLSLSMGQVPELHKWHAELQVDLSHAGARRLATAGELDGVRAQAQTFFQSLEGQLGDSMPKAPARMLSLSSSDSDGEQSFMTCIMKAVPNPMEVAQCCSDNMGSLMKMMTSFMSGKSP